MSIRARTTLPAALAMALIAMLGSAQIGRASHPRPVSASPLQVSLVPAYSQCTAANRTHGPPWDYPACNPPAQSSTSVTVGSVDANGADAQSRGSVRFAVKAGVPGPPEDSDVRVVVSIIDVRCRAGTSACGSANAADGADYTGQLQAHPVIRITDHFNAVAAGGGPDPATVLDIGLPVNLPCAATAATDTGGTCLVNTTVDAVIPTDAVRDGKRAVIEIQQVQVRDGGPDGATATAPNRLFAVQGLFVP